jgi:ABC-type polysaccharide/polyol phosphate transport system ATPase subunit
LVLQIVNLSKKYAWHRAPREAIDDDDPDLVETNESPLDETEPQGDRWALRGINITVQPGQRVGIIGANGSGKTTLLNILAGITLPSSGYVRGKGLCVLLNSLRTPFRGQLTGRQNLHILSALLGVDAARLEARLPEILAFSDMQDFIDRRVLHYSTQQYRRLTFAAALMLEPDIILSDDTLGIGDARYQQRTEQLIAEKVDKQGVIFMFASNRLSTVRDLCTRVIWLEQGCVAADGLAEDVIEAFLDADNADSVEQEFAREASEDDFDSPAEARSFREPGSNVVAYRTLGQRLAPPFAGEQSEKRRDGSAQQDGTDGVGQGHHEPIAATPPRDCSERPIVDLNAPRMPVAEWSTTAQDAVERYKEEHRKRAQTWRKSGRPWLTAEKFAATVPGIGELVSIRFRLGDAFKQEQHRLEIAVQLDVPGTEVAVFIDGVFNKVHVFSSELPGHFFAPSRGLYFFTVNIDSVLFQPRTFEQPYTKSKVRIKTYVRAPDSEQWQILSGIVRIHLQGTEWQPRIPYPENRGPVLKPLLDWSVENALDDASEASQPRPASSEDDDQIAALTQSGKR